MPNFTDHAPVMQIAELNIETAHQMALYANIAELELVAARAATAAAQESLSTLRERAESLGPGDRVVIRDAELSTLVGDRAVLNALMAKKARVDIEQSWVNMLSIAAHYRALHGRYDYTQSVDESELYNYADAVSCQYKSTILLKGQEQWPPHASTPDYLAINCLMRAGGFETISQAYSTIPPVGYSPLAREALHHAHISIVQGRG